MPEKFYYLISFVLVLVLAGDAPALELWSRDDYPGVELDWNDAYTWWGAGVPTTSEDDAHIDGWGGIVGLDSSAVAGEVIVGDYFTQWDPCQPTLNIYPGANLLLEYDPEYFDGDFLLGLQPYRDYGEPNWGNFGWGVVNMTGGTVIADGELAVGVDGVGHFYLKRGTLQADSLSFGTPRNATYQEDTKRVTSYDFNSVSNLMDISVGSKFILAGNITSIDSNVIAHGGTGDFVFDYEADVAGYTTITVEIDTAWYDGPVDGETVASPVVTLKWFPGRNVQDVNGHEVYFGTDFNDVNNADTTDVTGIYKGVQDANTYTPSLVWGQQYYWRIDEVNEINTRWKGPVWTFAVQPASATNPNPGDGTSDISILTDLTWASGAEAVTHDLYFSTDFNDVNDRSISPVTLGESSYNPGPLDFWTTYYWAVDEVNLAASPNTWPGQVWSFATKGFIGVDNFNSYALTDPDLLAVWDDYWVNGSGAEVFVQRVAPFVRDGNSIMYTYDNDDVTGSKYLGSWIDADTAGFEVGADWTVSGARALVLYFYGQPGNSITAQDTMWVELEDTSSVSGVARYDGDANDVAETGWHEWNIDLAIFDACGLSLTNVDKVHIGFGGAQAGGDTKNPGGTGTVYFDDVEVWPSRCRTELVPTDFTDDCVTDYYDIDDFSWWWLELGDYDVNAEPAPDTSAGGLLVRYEFAEVSGTIAADTSGSGNDGTVNVDTQWDPADGYDANGCLNLDSTANVQAPNDMFSLPMNEVTVSFWLKITGALDIWWDIPFSAGGDQDWFMMFAIASQANWDTETELPGYYVVWRTSTRNFDTEDSEQLFYDDLMADMPVGWHHYAGTKNALSGVQSLYIDGVMVAQSDSFFRTLGPQDPDNTDVLIGDSAGPDQWGPVPGKIDEFRIYGYALPHSQILDLAGQSSVNQPFQPYAEPFNLEKDGIINFQDYDVIAQHWLEGPILWPEP
jgi:hypothetical protein